MARRHTDRRTDDEEPTVIFLHIGKTAGMTMRQILRRQFRRSQIMVIRSPARVPRRLLREETLEYFASLPVEQRARPRLIMGHTIFGLHEFVPRPCVYITLLRDPFRLAVSQYNFVRRTPGHWLHGSALRMSLREYVESGVALEMDNSQTRALSGDVSTEFGRCTRGMLETAMRNIEDHFTVVGLTERFDETLVLLGEAFGWSRLAYVRANVAPSRYRQDVSAETAAMVSELNVLDQELYERTATSFQRSIDADLSFDRELRRLRLAKTVYRPWGNLTQTLRRRVRSKIPGV
jgi:Galactose-3-O-sulfotransferase